MLPGRLIAHLIYAFCSDSDVTESATGLDDLSNIELRTDNLKMLDQAWDDMKKESEWDPPPSLRPTTGKSLPSTVVKSSTMKNALALRRSGQFHRKERKSFTNLTALVTDNLEDQQQGTAAGQKRKDRVKDNKAMPNRSSHEI